MSLLVGMGVLTALAMVVIWAPPYPEERHEHLRAMDALADPVRLHDCGRFHRASERCPGRRRCTSCRAPLDALGNCCGVCDPADAADWER